ncbi:hypothetical protein HK097_009691 [Rhizophlyctis rosea]|uniref:DUF6697 domain-containing protein n=1 Tax=Rhizophlyctis rosea TaxID=64517 RepID=A0AAD5X317_9FUNG|nr:hypothetical protein HK097_009691 [Rhizophlyctis rosea]
MAKRAKTSASNTKPKGRAGSSHSGDPEDPSDVAGSSLGVNIKVEVKLEDSEDESTPSSSSAPAPPPASNAASATPEYTITLEVKLEGGQERLHINIDALDPLLGPGQDDLPIPEEPFLSDKVIDPVMGGGSQVTFPTATKYGRGKKFGRLKRVWNPSLPLAPGKHGVVFVRNKDVMPLAQKILSMFGRLPGEDHKHGFRYLGEYAVFYRGKLTPEQFAALPPATKTEWINGHLEKWQKDLKDRNLPNDRADVEAALEEGELAVYFYILKFDSFDEKLHDLLLTRQRVVKEGKRSRKDTGARKQKKNGVVVSSDDQGLSQIHRRRPSAPKTTATSNSSPPTPPSTPRVLTESSSSTRPQQNLRKSSRRFTPASNVELDDMETSELSDETENHFEEATPSLIEKTYTVRISNILFCIHSDVRYTCNRIPVVLFCTASDASYTCIRIPSIHFNIPNNVPPVLFSVPFETRYTCTRFPFTLFSVPSDVCYTGICVHFILFCESSNVCRARSSSSQENQI